MKKFFAFAVVAVSMAFVSCGGNKADEKAIEDALNQLGAELEAAADSLSAAVDSATVALDSAAQAVDEAL